MPSMQQALNVCWMNKNYQAIPAHQNYETCQSNQFFQLNLDKYLLLYEATN